MGYRVLNSSSTNRIFVGTLTKGDFFDGEIVKMFEGQGYKGRSEDKIHLKVSSYKYEEENEKYPIEIGGLVELPVTTVIGNCIKNNNITVGDMIRLTYLGKAEGKGDSPYHNFEIAVYDGDDEEQDVNNVF